MARRSAGSGGGCATSCTGNTLHLCNALGSTTDLDCGAATCDAGSGSCLPSGKVTAIASGAERNCAVSQGQAYCWGFSKQTLGVGIAESADVVLPTAVSGMSGVVALWGGRVHTCARKADSSLWCWGNNDGGALGVGGQPLTAVPITVPGAIDLAAGFSATCARTAGGTVSCWGNNTFGQLGNGTTNASVSPVVVGTYPDAVQLVLGTIGCVLHATGKATCWGTGSVGAGAPADLGVDSAVELATGGYDQDWVFARRADGSLVGVRSTPDGQAYAAPVSIAVPGGAKIAAMAAGNQLCLLLADGSVQCADYDALGVKAFAPVPLLGAGTTVSIAAGYSSSNYTLPIACALSGAGEVRCWGSNLEGELGNDKPDNLKAPQQMQLSPAAMSSGVAALTVGGQSTVVTLNDGSVVWAGTSPGLGSGTPVPIPAAAPFLSGGYAKVVVGSYGDTVGYAVKKGPGGGVDHFSYASISTDALATATTNDFTDAAPGINYDVALAKNGDVVFWAYSSGAADYAEFGADPVGQTITPNTFYTLVGKGTPASLLSYLSHGSGERGHHCLLAGGQLWCWGSSVDGEIGTGLSGNAPPANGVGPPVQPVVPGTSVTSACVGANHTCAVNDLRDLYCWGDSTWGQNGQATQTTTPTPVTLGGKVDGVACGRAFTCAWADGGVAYCFGQNHRGQLADGTLVSHPAPSQPVFPLGVKAMALGDGHGCAKLTDGTVWCMGSSYRGQSGANVVGGSATPVLAQLP